MTATDAGGPDRDLVLGGDLGGTSTRVLVADRSGRCVGRGVAGGGNPISHPVSASVELARALAEALRGLDPTQVRAAVIGAAGASVLIGDGSALIGDAGGSASHAAQTRAAFGRAWTGAGLSVAPAYLSDLEVAFASGTPARDGTVLIVGTGAAAGAISDGRLTRTADGHGWLLGDDGSGFWLGREAVRATLRTLDGHEPLGPLGRAVVSALLGRPPDGERLRATGGPGALRDELITAANSRPPVRLAELARPVAVAYEAGDPAAAGMVERAVELLVDTVGRIRGGAAGEGDPLVIAGSVAGEATPVGRRLRAVLGHRVSGEIRTAHDGLAGAVRLALRSLDPDLGDRETLAHLGG